MNTHYEETVNTPTDESDDQPGSTSVYLSVYAPDGSARTASIILSDDDNATIRAAIDEVADTLKARYIDWSSAPGQS
jgi:hypothetical protein